MISSMKKEKKYMVDAWNKGQMKNTFKNGGNDMKEKTYYVIQNKEGKFFTLDDSSGGYPVFVNDFEFCEKYDSEKSANNFLNGKYVTEQFATKFIGAKVRKVTAKVLINKEIQEKKKNKLATEIVESFEKLLDKKGIEIPCDDEVEQKDRYEGGNAAKLYGMEYYNLVSNVQNLLYEQDSSFDISE